MLQHPLRATVLTRLVLIGFSNVVRAQTWSFTDIANNSAPAGGILFENIGTPSINSKGDMAFTGQRPAPTVTTHLNLYSTGGGITNISLEGMPAPGGGTFASLTGFTDFGNNNNLIFSSSLTLLGGGSGTGLYRYNTSTSVLSKMIQTGDIVDGRTVQSVVFGDTNRSNDTVLKVGFTDPAITEGILKISDAGVISTIALRGDAAAGGSVFNSFGLVPTISESGDISFMAGLAGGVNQAIFRIAGGTTSRLVTTGDAAPGGGIFSSLDGGPRALDGNTNFWAQTMGGPGSGIYRFSSGSLTRLVGATDSAPGGGTLGAVGGGAFNTVGDMVLSSTRPGDSNESFFFYRAGATEKVLLNGGALFGSTTSGQSFTPWGINDSGTFAFQYTLANGRSGVAIASSSAPEPSTLALLSLGVIGSIAARRRTRK